MIESDNGGNAQEEVSDCSQACCVPGTAGGDCCPTASAESGRGWKTVIFVVIVLAAGGVLAKSLVEKSNQTSSPSQDQTGFSAIQSGVNSKDISTSSLWRADLDSLSALNTAAADTDAVFILLLGEDQQDSSLFTSEINAAAQKLASAKFRVSAFRLKQTAPEYAQLSKQASMPCVLAMAKGGGMIPVSGQISETRLIQAFVAASRPSSGCGPAGCCP